MSKRHGLINVAIDGPAGAGKSTVARLVAERLGYIYIDTGAMYRALTWKTIVEGIAVDHASEVALAAERLDLKFIPGPNGQRVMIDGREVTEDIRSSEVTRSVSLIAQNRQVRELLSARQKRLAKDKGVVMDGRDIGTNVLPDAEVKVFLTASVDERATRRYKEMSAGQHGTNLTLEALKHEINERDQMDEQRAVSPLVIAKDATLVDTTNMTIDEVVHHIVQLCNRAAGEG